MTPWPSTSPDLFSNIPNLVSQSVSGAGAAAAQGALQGVQGGLPSLVQQASQAVQSELPALAAAGGQAVQGAVPLVQQAVAPAAQQVAQQAGQGFGQGAVQGAKEESVAPVVIVATGVTLLALVIGVAAWRSRKPEVRAAEQRLPFVGMLGAAQDKASAREVTLLIDGRWHDTPVDGPRKWAFRERLEEAGLLVEEPKGLDFGHDVLMAVGVPRRDLAEVLAEIEQIAKAEGRDVKVSEWVRPKSAGRLPFVGALFPVGDRYVIWGDMAAKKLAHLSAPGRSRPLGRKGDGVTLKAVSEDRVTLSYDAAPNVTITLARWLWDRLAWSGEVRPQQEQEVPLGPGPAAHDLALDLIETLFSSGRRGAISWNELSDEARALVQRDPLNKFVKVGFVMNERVVALNKEGQRLAREAGLRVDVHPLVSREIGIEKPGFLEWSWAR